jgi:hypothetical protein
MNFGSYSCRVIFDFLTFTSKRGGIPCQQNKTRQSSNSSDRKAGNRAGSLGAPYLRRQNRGKLERLGYIGHAKTARRHPIIKSADAKKSRCFDAVRSKNLVIIRKGDSAHRESPFCFVIGTPARRQTFFEAGLHFC